MSTESGARTTGAAKSFFASVAEALAGSQQDYTEGPLPRAILLLAVPMVLEMAFESVFAVVDIFFVSRLGPDAVATVGLTESMLTIVYAIAIGLSMGTTAMVARRIGEKKPEAASKAGAQAIWIGLIVSVVIGLPCFFLAPTLLGAMGASAAVVEEGVGYTRILLGANVVIVLLFLHNAIFRGAGDAAVAMRSLWLANGINIVLDPCLIFGLGPFPELGVTGAAVATTIGRGTGVLYQVWHLRSGAHRVRIDRPAMRLDPAAALRLLQLSMGGIGQFLIATASWVVLIRIVAPFGSAALAGYTIAVRIVMFAFLPAWGLSNSAATLVGQNLGAGKPDRAERSVWLTGLYNMVFLAVVTVVFVAFAGPLVRVFTDDEAVLEVGIESLRVISYGYVFYSWGMVMVQAFNGSGDTKTPTWINLFCFWMLQIPLAWILAREVGLGAPGVFWAVAISESVLALVAIALFRRGKWKTQRV